MMRSGTRTGGMVLGTAVVLALAAQTRADFVLELVDLNGPTSVVVIDNQLAGAASDSGLLSTVGDLNPDLGAVAYSGSIGSTYITFNAGVSKPLGRPGTLDLLTLQISGAAANLRLRLTDNNYVLPVAGQGTLVSSISGSTDGTVSYNQIYDAANLEFGGPNPGQSGSTTILSGAFGTGSFSETKSAPITIATPYSLTEEVFVTHTGPGTTTFNIVSEVIREPFIPEPASMALMGFGGLAMLRRRRRNR